VATNKIAAAAAAVTAVTVLYSEYSYCVIIIYQSYIFLFLDPFPLGQFLQQIYSFVQQTKTDYNRQQTIGKT
jgi:hypothetical protein